MAYLLHATTVAFDGRGILLIGPSGVGKSALALQLMAMGAHLVADDQTIITRQDDDLVASCPPQIKGLIEARGVGLLRAEVVETAKLVLAVDLGQKETERLPPKRTISVLDHSLVLVLGQDAPHFAASLRQYVLCGRHD